jgi:putative transposase
MKKSNAIPPVLTYEEYQEKLKGLTTPEAVMAFAQELVAPALKNLDEQGPIEDQDDEPAPAPVRPVVANPAPQQPVQRQRRTPPAQANVQSPWYDIVSNDTEAMVIDLYAKGLTTRDIVNHLKRAHSTELSQPAISAITDKVMPLVREWQTRPLSSIYPVVYLDGLHFKVRDAGKITSKVAYVALGINLFGQKEILGLWVGETEGAKFWMHVLNDMKNRGVDDILITCVDGLKGFPDAIKTIFPKTDVQLCVVHQIRHTVMFISHKDRERFCNDLKSVYMAVNEQEGLNAVKDMEKHWPQYAAYMKSWENRWSDLAPFFNYPEQIKRLVYTTNAIENLNRQFRKVTKTTQVFPHDEALMKLLWLAQTDITEKWTFPVRSWGEVMAQLTILFPDRIQF